MVPCLRLLPHIAKSSQGWELSGGWIQSSRSFFVAAKKGRGELMVWDPEKATLATRTNPKLSCVELKATQTRTIATPWRGQSSAVSKRPPLWDGTDATERQKDKQTCAGTERRVMRKWKWEGDEQRERKQTNGMPGRCLILTAHLQANTNNVRGMNNWGLLIAETLYWCFDLKKKKSRVWNSDDKQQANVSKWRLDFSLELFWARVQVTKG